MIEQKSPCADLEIASLMPLVGRIMCHVRQQTSLIYKDLGYNLTPETVDALMAIHHFDGLSQKQLANTLGKDKAAITRLLNTLVKSNLVERTQDLQDRRIIRANITAEGKEAFLKIYPKLQLLSDCALNGINKQDFNATLSVLSNIIENMACPPPEK